ncbi:DER1-domain-containing protein [Patellaria atrata CBS 101060]|uniref:Derlin n=1 Tax=Patellaria atrata CBS 101060 TaxID=1346257 RepID=A0A9P4SFB7_9PEZI|nr:DER1-domain-containing protein [Patellaria atrata CBS 101060]
MDAFWAAPPISRTIAAAAFALSLLVHTDNLDIYRVIFISQTLFQIPPHVWRLFTSFLITGPKLSIILDPYFLFNYGSALEKSSPRFTGPGDFFTYVVFCSVMILLIDGYILGAFFFMHPLLMAFCYTYAQDEPNRQVNYFFITLPAKLLPYAMLFVTFIMAGTGAVYHELVGLFVGHLHDFLTRTWPNLGGGRNLLRTPNFVKPWFGEGQPRVTDAGTAYPARGPPSARVESRPNVGGSGSWTSGFRGLSGSGNNFGNAGPGRRLGGE